MQLVPRLQQSPGTGIIFMFLSIEALTNLYPGSDIPGVPAFEIIAIFFPSINFLITLGICLVELCSL